MKEIERSLEVQRHQLNELEMKSSSIHKVFEEINDESGKQESSLSELEGEIAELKKLMMNLDEIDQNFDSKIIDNQLSDQLHFNPTILNKLSSTPIVAGSWDEYYNRLNGYIEEKQLKLTEDPLDSLLTEQHKLDIISQVRDDYKIKSANCDKYDYVIASFCGIFSGLIDVFFVGTPEDSLLCKWTDKKVDGKVIQFAQRVFKMDKANGANVRKEPDSIESAIGYLERRFKVNYDARYKSDLNLTGESFSMNPSNHHLKSLGHSPDIIGLFFSILDQFTRKASFISDGKIIRAVPIEGTNSFKLQGDTLISRLFAGFANWLGHLISDIAGSSGTRGHDDGRRGSGIPIPFYNLFQLCDFGSINVNADSKTISEFSTKVFESGYDTRFAATMSIPIIINELSIRLLWSLKSLFYHNRGLRESIPIGNKPELRRMLVVGYGAFCLVDGTDAFIRSGGDALLLATRLNMVAWSRFSFAALKEARALHLEKGIDIEALDRDLEKEWERLFEEIKK